MNYDNEKAAIAFVQDRYPEDIFKSAEYDGIRVMVAEAFQSGAIWARKDERREVMKEVLALLIKYYPSLSEDHAFSELRKFAEKK